MARALLLVPPFIKYSSGPLLGPALLQSAARLRGHDCTVVDLNAHYIQPRVSKRTTHGAFIGDHDKPRGPHSLSQVEEDFVEQHILSSLLTSYKEGEEDAESIRRVHFGFLRHDQVEATASCMAASSFGRWVEDILLRNSSSEHQEEEEEKGDPQVIGVSLLHAGQVVPAVAISMVAKRIWPNAVTVWGGPHISGLGRRTLEHDLEERAFAADIFVTGHAEETWTQILDSVAASAAAGWTTRRTERPRVLDGVSGRHIAPSFDNLAMYDDPLTLPAQSSLGCSYGRCTFCTYPAIEANPQRLDLSVSVGTVVDRAKPLAASVSIKDSLVTATRLSEIGGCIRNRVPWSACTKLSQRLDLDRLTQLNANGLATLEVGLESLLEETQERIHKVQPQSLYEQFVADVSKVPDLSLVVNYMVGFPWEDQEAALAKLQEAEYTLERHLGGGFANDRACIELNDFELERLAPMARFPELYGIDPRQIRSWPWASVLEYKKAHEQPTSTKWRLSR